MSEQHNPYERLWNAALACYLDDAMMFYRFTKAGRKLPSTRHGLEEAYNDLTGCGRILQRLCDKTGHSPEWLKELFQKHLSAT